MVHAGTTESGHRDAAWVALNERGPFLVATFSTAGLLTALNRAPDGRAPATLVGHRMADLIPGSGGPDVDVILERVVAHDVSERVEVPARLNDQQMGWLELNLLPIRVENRVCGVLVLGANVTERKQAALELRMTVNALHRTIEAREQLAADLHDGTLQSLYGVGLRLEAVRAAMVPLGEEAELHLERAIDEIKVAMHDIRRHLAEGVSGIAPPFRWDEALSGLLRGLEVEGGPVIDVELDDRAMGRIADSGRGEVVFVAREAVSNAMRHAAATRVSVRLFETGSMVRLEVEDDGTGFTQPPDRNGFGLLTMTRRAAQVGGVLSVESVPGVGTVVRLDLPDPVEPIDG